MESENIKLSLFIIAVIYQQKTDATITDMKAGMLANKNDIAALKTRVTTAEDKLAAIDKQAQANRNASATNQANIVKIQDDIMYLKTRTDTLAASSDLWKQNFQVVNRTFEELKKKYALVIPGVPRA